MSYEIIVGNKHHGAIGEYIGRGNPLGNPYKVKPFGPYERGQTIEMYREHLKQMIASRNPAVCNELNRLYRICKDTGSLTIVCFCKPKACHGDVIRDVLLEALNK